MEILHYFLSFPTGNPFLPFAEWSELWSGNYQYHLGTSLPVLCLPKVLHPAAHTTPLCSSLFPLPQPEAIPFPTQQIAYLRAKEVSLHLSLKEVGMLVLCEQQPAYPLTLTSIPGSCYMYGRTRASPAVGRGGSRLEKPCKAQHTVWRRWEKVQVPTRSCLLALSSSFLLLPPL